MAGKAKKISSKAPRGRWLKYLAPALALPVVVIGGLYAGALYLNVDGSPERAASVDVVRAGDRSAEPTVMPGRAASKPAKSPVPTGDPAAQRRHGVEMAAIDPDNLRITDTVVRDGSGESNGDGARSREGAGDRPEIRETPGGPTQARPGNTAAEAPSPARPSSGDQVAVESAGAGTGADGSTDTATLTYGAGASGSGPLSPPLWMRNAIDSEAGHNRPMIALVIDDVGPNLRNARRSIMLPGPLTLAFLPYAAHLDELTANARRARHELLVHMPMEPEGTTQDPGPNALLSDLTPVELQRRLNWSLERFSGYVGLNNHMGSRFTRSRAGMDLVMAELKRRGLLFLDSRTIATSRGEDAAAAFGVPFVERDLFIDNDYRNPASIERQLSKLEDLARRQGYAIAIGHPHDETLDVLSRWLPRVAERGFVLVPVSQIVKRQIQLVHADPSTVGHPGKSGRASP